MTLTAAVPSPIHADVADLVAQLRAVEAAMPDVGSLASDNDKADWYARRATISTTIAGLLNTSDPGKHERLLAEHERRRAIVVAAQATIDQQLDDAPDWRLGDHRTSTREWARQQALAAAKRALVVGVEYMSGHPCVPHPLREIFGEVIEADGRRVPTWYGSLTWLEEEIARLTPLVEARREAYEQHRATAAALLKGFS